MKGENMKYILFIVIMVAVILAAGCAQQSPATSQVTPAPTVTSCENRCNGICYDTVWNDCCGGTIYPHDYSNFKTGSCCGEKWYPTNQTGICCGGIMYPANKTRTCCGGQMFEGYSRDCCGGIMYSRKESISSSCCGGQMYPNNITGWTCCAYSNRAVNGIWYDISTQHCCEGKVESGAVGGGWAKCGQTCYQPMIQSCCYDYGPSYQIIKQGVNSCCAAITIPEDMKCYPETGDIRLKNYSGYNCGAGTGPGSCSQEYSKYSYEHIINNR